MGINSLSQFERYLQKHIPSREELFAGDHGLGRTKELLRLLGNPQEKLNVVHIAGTSGKGSTASYISTTLLSQGFTTGLSLSPHILDIRERFQLNNTLISEKKTLHYFNNILPFLKKMEKSSHGIPTYFEILTCLAFYIFWKENVSYAVMETGLGGLYDATNIIRNKHKFCVLTRLGLDHTDILGKSIEKIAFQKGSIMQNGNMAVSTWQNKKVKAVFNNIASKKKAKIYFLKTGDRNIVSQSSRKTIFHFKHNDFSLNKIALSSGSSFQAENCSLALFAISFLSKRDRFKINKKKIKDALFKKQLPARMQIIQKFGKDVILDGAHNPQKIKALIADLQKNYPQTKFVFIVAFKKSKDWQEMLSLLIAASNHIFLTSITTANKADYQNFSVNPQEMAFFLNKQKYENYTIIENNKTSIQNTIKKSTEKIVITGSFYLIGSVLKHL